MPEISEDIVRALRTSVKEAAALREANERLTAAAREPIAIVGTGCRYAAGISSAEDLWATVAEGRDAIGPFPTDRGWDLDALYDPDPDVQGTCYTTQGGFIEGATLFDPAFFGMSPREAVTCDPQQRLFLEVAWETFEHARIAPDSLHGSPTGVFVGAAYQGFGEGWRTAPDGLQGHLVTGMSMSVLSGRVAYHLGLAGPTATIDTACSSSLVAVHLAIQSLRQGDCSLALAGGVAVISQPIGLVGFSRQRGISLDGRCRAFSADADGMGLGEGVGAVLLERLGDARRNGHRVLGVITGIAINSDGASNGLAAPSGPAQQAVIDEALARAGLDYTGVDLVETHGTGTRLGDPIEADALLASYGSGRRDPVLIGSVKTNIGHSQAASGIAGIIKVLKALEHAELPRSLHAEQLSPIIDWDSGAVEVLRETRPWPDLGRPRRGAVSSFGLSGTNVHMIIEEPGGRPGGSEPSTGTAAGGSTASTPATGPLLPCVLSARTEAALTEAAARLLALVEGDLDADVARIAWSLATTRTTFASRAVVLARTRADLLRGLRALVEGLPDDDVLLGEALPDAQPVLVFPGQGSQWAGMARDLLATSEPFAARLRECDAALLPHTGWSLLAVLDGQDETWMDRVDVVQPVLWAVMVALAAVWAAHGVEPAAVMGHSQGEIAAAVVAGALSLSDGAAAVALRSSAITGIAGRGGMLSVALPPGEILDLLAGRDGDLALAAVNGPRSAVVSGGTAHLDRFQAELEAAGVRTRRVAVDYASHSSHVETIREEILRRLAPVAPLTPEVLLVSALTGRPVEGPDLDATYWYRNLRGTVLLDEATRCLAGLGHAVFVECSAHPVLLPALSETLAEADPGGEYAVIGTLRRDDGGADRLCRSAAELFAHGGPVDLASLLPAGLEPVDLPTYPFQRGHYLFEAPPDAAVTAGSDLADATAPFWTAVERQDARALADTLEVEDGTALGELLPALARYRSRSLCAAEADALRYRVRWSVVPAPTAPDRAGTWLVAVPPAVDAATVDAVTAALGPSARTLAVGTGDGEDALARRLAEAGPLTGILSLLSLDCGPRPGSGDTGQTVGLAATITLTRAVASLPESVSLWHATTGAVSTAPADPVTAPLQAATWGFGRIAALEYSGRAVGLVDLPARLDTRAGQRLRAVLAGIGEREVAVRGSGIFARRLDHAGPAPHDRPWRPRGTVLITGGTGALASHVARWAATAGAERLVLAGRRGPAAPGAHALAAELGETGCEVSAVACDMGDRAQVADLLSALPDLTAVVHTAGVLDDCLIGSLAPERVDAVFRPKTAGALHLHDLLAGRELDAFILFSSFAGTAGGIGQAGYAAANAVLDALALARRADGLAATSLAWGAWAGGGLVDADTAARLAADGVRGMDPALAVDAMAREAGSGEAATVLADIDWQRLRDASPQIAENPVLAGLAERSAPASASAPATPPPSRWTRASLTDLVRGQVASVLRYDDPTAVEPDRAFRDLGFDSLIAVDLRRRLGQATGLTLPVTLVFDHPTVTALVDHLTGLLGDPGPDTAEAAPASATAAVVTAEREPLAVVSVGCRFPGGADSPEAFWQLLADGRDVVGDLPRDRGWDIEGRYDPDLARPGTFSSNGGAFLYDAADFDAELFGISPREAMSIDPQQRLLLETAWEAFERAGIDPLSVKGRRMGVFLGKSYNDYGSRPGAASPEVEGYLALGSANSVASGRISYVFGLEGPAVTVDTACSSSLVALHLARQAVHNGDCDAALVGGVVVMSTLHSFIEFSRLRAMSPDGRCRAFSADADGAGWAEGVGVVLLERLSEARRLGHRVLAVVRGSAMNQDGASNGLTAPSGPAQRKVIEQALADAGMAGNDVDAVEAHGTGTTLGDPIEAGALIDAYGPGRTRPLFLGSVKSNISHTQAAAGIASFIKAVLCLEHSELPRTLHASRPSPHVDWSAGTLKLLTEPVPWPRGERPRAIGVSAFGVSGTNVHVIVADPADDEAGRAPSGTAPAGTASTSPLIPWVLSANGPSALRGQAGRMLDAPETSPERMGLSLATTRAALPERAVVLGTDLAQLRSGLALLAEGATSPQVVTGRARSLRLAILFTGQGSQRARMGAELYESFPPFADAFDEACAHLDPHLRRPLAEVIRDGADLESTEFAQPALFAVEVALFRLARAWGVRPDLLVGHSIGEFAAACAAEVLSLPDAALLVAARGRLMQSLPGGGAMLSVQASEETVAALLASTSAPLDVAAVNGPVSTVVSGAADAVDELARRLAADGVRTRRLVVSHAFHSPLMEPALARFREVAESVAHAPARLPIVSTLTGEIVTSVDADYWVRQARSTVRFADALRTCAAEGAGAFLELGPGGVLTTMARDCLGMDAVLAASLRADRPEAATFLTALAQVYTAGAAVDWTAAYGGTDPAPVPLPTYAFQRRRYWLDATDTPDVTQAGLEVADHPLLGAAVDLPDGGEVLTGSLSRTSHPWLADHAVGASAILPGTAFLDLALHVGSRTGTPVVEELAIEAPLVLPPSGSVRLTVVVGAPDAGGVRTVAVHSTGVAGHVRHAAGTLLPRAVPPPAGEAAAPWPPDGAVPIPTDDLYERMEAGGFDYGESFRGLGRVWHHGEDIVAEAALPEAVRDAARSHPLHPALLDAALHTLAFAPLEGIESGLVPFSWARVSLGAAGADRLRVRVSRVGPDAVRVEATGVDGMPVAVIERLTLRPVPRAALAEAAADRSGEAVYRMAWQDPGEPAEAARCATVTVLDELGGDGGTADALAAALADAGTAVTRAAGVTSLRAETPPDAVLLPLAPAPAGERDLAARARSLTADVLDALQQWIAADHADSRLVVVTRQATDEQEPDPAQAAAAGLVRSAGNEHPGRFGLVDTDPSPQSLRAVAEALARTDEPSLRTHGGTLHAARLLPAPAAEAERPVFGAEGTVLVTGGTGTLGALLARHLVTRRGVRHLILASRRGGDAPGAQALREELVAAGATVTLAAVDATDEDTLTALVKGVDPAHPVSAVIHAAGIVDDGVITALAPGRLDRVLASKADAALALHRATAHLPLDAFLLYSSIAGIVGSAGQGSYAAANAFLDAFARTLRARGVRAQSLAWGLWEEASGMTGSLGERDRRRAVSSGVEAMPTARALALFDTAVATGLASCCPACLDPQALARQAGRGMLQPVFRGLVRLPVHRPRAAATTAPDTVTDRLAGLEDGARAQALLDVVRSAVAAVLGHTDPGDIDADRGLLDLGFDSLTAVELRNSLQRTTGLRLPVTLLFDHPTSRAVAAYLDTLVAPDRGEKDRADRSQHARDGAQAAALAELAGADDDDLFAFIDRELER
jgi:acyl transferase domain-containing protein/acyl carrier protein